MRRPLLPVLLLGALAARQAGAAPAAPPVLRALPGPGAALVSPQSSIYIGGAAVPDPLMVEVDGKPAPSGAATHLGPSLSGSWWRLPGPLPAGATVVVRGTERGATRELTRFTTAAAADHTAAAPSTATRLRVWRVQYPRDQVGRDGITREFEGYVDVVYQPGLVPGTPDGEVLTVFQLAPKSGGGPTQTYVVAGRQRVPLAIAGYVASSNPEVPDGLLPSSRYSLWHPSIEPDLEYCITITLHGRNDLAVPPPTSASICTAVINATAPGYPDAGPDDGPAPPDAGADTALPAPPDAESPASDASPKVLAPPADAGAAQDAKSLAASGGDCAIARGPVSPPWLALVALALAALRRLRGGRGRGRVYA
jgi:hypothetical protein